MLTTYISYAVSVWIGFGLMYMFGVMRHNDTAAGVWLAVLPLMFLAPSVELLLYVDSDDKKAITRYVAHHRFATIRLIAIGAAAGAFTLWLLNAIWETGWSYSQSSTMTSALLFASMLLSLAGPIGAMSALIYRAKALSKRVNHKPEECR